CADQGLGLLLLAGLGALAGADDQIVEGLADARGRLPAVLLELVLGLLAGEGLEGAREQEALAGEHALEARRGLVLVGLRALGEVGDGDVIEEAVDQFTALD